MSNKDSLAKLDLSHITLPAAAPYFLLEQHTYYDGGEVVECDDEEAIIKNCRDTQKDGSLRYAYVYIALPERLTLIAYWNREIWNYYLDFREAQ